MCVCTACCVLKPILLPREWMCVCLCVRCLLFGLCRWNQDSHNSNCSNNSTSNIHITTLATSSTTTVVSRHTKCLISLTPFHCILFCIYLFLWVNPACPLFSLHFLCMLHIVALCYNMLPCFFQLLSPLTPESFHVSKAVISLSFYFLLSRYCSSFFIACFSLFGASRSPLAASCLRFVACVGLRMNEQVGWTE